MVMFDEVGFWLCWGMLRLSSTKERRVSARWSFGLDGGGFCSPL